MLVTLENCWNNLFEMISCLKNCFEPSQTLFLRYRPLNVVLSTAGGELVAQGVLE